MKYRVKKRRLYAQLQRAVLLPRRFVQDTLRALEEVRAGQVAPYVFGLWKGCNGEGMAYQERVRSEWPLGE